MDESVLSMCHLGHLECLQFDNKAIVNITVGGLSESEACLELTL